MKKFSFGFVAGLLFFVVTVSFSQNNGPADLVDPFIGTGGHGHTYPGAVFPFGMVQLSPDTRLTGWDGCSGYHYTDTVTYGFSHTHLSGTGVSDYGDILFMPFTGKPNRYEHGKIGSGFSHEQEMAKPGVYFVTLQDYDIDVVLTATERCGFHKYIFKKADKPKLLLDLIHRDHVTDSYIKIKNEYEIEGYRYSSAWAKDQRIYFSARFSIPVSSFQIMQGDELEILPEQQELKDDSIQLQMDFDLADGDELLVKVGVSAVSIEGARKNLQAELPNWDFTGTINQARDAWNDQLSKIEVFGRSKTDQIVFYTALYHTMIVPNLFNDVDGRYRGLDGQIYQDSTRNTYTVFSLWDTYRATHPLYTLIEQERTVDFIKTMLAHYDQTGLLPVWELAGNETNCMIGTHGVSVISDAMIKDIKGFDFSRALDAMKGNLDQDKPELNEYRKYGFMPSNLVIESVSKTLEYAYDDWCLAVAANKLGRVKDYTKFIQRAQYYKNMFDPETGFMRPRLNGGWRSPFDPKQVDFNYTEANSWQYSFYAPQDITGLIGLMGGETAFESKLDELFTTDSKTTGRHQADITGLIGQYAHGNEPSHHMAYLYNYIGKPWKSQEYIGRIMDEMYSDQPDGYSGNEDCGQMSAWYVFSALGFYPVTPGSDVYVLGKPLFPRAIINFENGSHFIIESSEIGGNEFVKSVQWDKVPYQNSYFKHQDLLLGGKLSFYLSDEPGETYGVNQENRPATSIVDHPIIIAPYLKNGAQSFTDEHRLELTSFQENVSLKYRIQKEDKRFSRWKDYSQPIVVDYSGTIEFFAVGANGKTSKIQSSRFVKRVENWQISLENGFDDQYTGGGPNGLIDKIRGGENFSDGSWQGFQGHDFIATLDLGESMNINKISVGMLQSQKSWIWFPLQLDFYGSTDGDNFEKLGRVIPGVDPKIEHTLIEEFSFEIKKRQARYIKIKAKNRVVCPEWHPGAGGKAWLFVDEIIVE